MTFGVLCKFWTLTLSDLELPGTFLCLELCPSASFTLGGTFPGGTVVWSMLNMSGGPPGVSLTVWSNGGGRNVAIRECPQHLPHYWRWQLATAAVVLRAWTDGGGLQVAQWPNS